MNRILYKGIYIYPITTQNGWTHYYDHLKYRSRIYAENPPVLRKTPTIVDYEEYMALKSVALGFNGLTGTGLNKVLKKLAEYETEFDWRDQLVTGKGSDECGLISVTGKTVVPRCFSEIRERTNSIIDSEQFIPVRIDENWGIVTTGDNSVCALPFKFQNIITERWEKRLFFVQDRDSNWGTYRIINNFHNGRPFKSAISIPSIEPFVPLEFDTISEAELEDTCAPVTYWILHKDDKIGIMTESSYTPAIFDSIQPIHEDWDFLFVKDDKRIRLGYHEIERAATDLQ